jgi:hypothetical protein
MTERKTYTKDEIQALARRLGYAVNFQFNTARNTGKTFEVGYVWPNGLDEPRELFCKDNSDSGVFIVCNDYEIAVEKLMVEDQKFEDAQKDTKRRLSEPCCKDEHRNMNGGCDNCGDPCL